MRTCLMLVGIVFFLVFKSMAQEIPSINPSLKRSLDSLCLQDISNGSPGIVTGIVRNGQIVYQRWDGLADLGKSTPIGPNTRFNLASNGKQFTALAILVLAAQGRLTEDQDIRVFLPYLFQQLPERITIRHLLTHTSGIRDVYDLWSLQGITWWEKTFSNTDAIKLLEKQKELNFPPGTGYLYSNSNYILLADIVAKASGKDFRTFTDSIFQALGMHQTHFETEHKRIQGSVAWPYFNFNTWTTYPWVWDVVGDGNFFSTLNDQLLWESVLQGGIQTPVSTKLIRASQLLPPAHKSSQYGYGLEFGGFRDLPYRFHEGATGAWKATVLRFPDSNFSIFTATNSGKSVPSMHARQIAALLLPKAIIQAADEKKPLPGGAYYSLKELEGTYMEPDGFYFRFEQRDSSLYLIRSGRNDMRLVRSAGNIFYQWNDAVFQQEFARSSDESMLVTAYHSSHAPYSLSRPNVDWTGFNDVHVEGNYINTETDLRIQIESLGKHQYRLIRGRDTSNAFLVSRNLMLADPYQFSWASDASEPVGEIFLQSGRLRRVRFLRIPATIK